MSVEQSWKMLANKSFKRSGGWARDSEIEDRWTPPGWLEGYPGKVRE